MELLPTSAWILWDCQVDVYTPAKPPPLRDGLVPQQLGQRRVQNLPT